jgi:hypothetical protein
MDIAHMAHKRGVTSIFARVLMIQSAIVSTSTIGFDSRKSVCKFKCVIKVRSFAN